MWSVKVLPMFPFIPLDPYFSAIRVSQGILTAEVFSFFMRSCPAVCDFNILVRIIT